MDYPYDIRLLSTELSTPHFVLVMVSLCIKCFLLLHSVRATCTGNATSCKGSEAIQLVQHRATKMDGELKSIAKKATPVCTDGDVKAANEVGVMISSISASTMFTPYVLQGSGWHPICGHDFWAGAQGGAGATTS